jgi:hypothetical protein
MADTTLDASFAASETAERRSEPTFSGPSFANRMPSHHRLALCLCLPSLAACSPRPGSADTPAPASVTEARQPERRDCKLRTGHLVSDTTLVKACSPYEVHGGIDVLENVTLTIEPGVEVRFARNDWLEISAAGTRAGRLIARGTAEEPIVLTTLNPGSASSATWLGLWFNAGTAEGSIVSHAIVRAAGGSNQYIKPTPVQGCITLTDVAPGAVTIADVTLENCVNAGIVLRNSMPQLMRLSMKNMQAGFRVSGSTTDLALASVRFTNVAKQFLRDY